MPSSRSGGDRILVMERVATDFWSDRTVFLSRALPPMECGGTNAALATRSKVPNVHNSSGVSNEQRCRESEDMSPQSKDHAAASLGAHLPFMKFCQR